MVLLRNMTKFQAGYGDSHHACLETDFFKYITQKILIPVQAVAAAGRSTAEVAAVADSVAVVFVVVDNIQRMSAWLRDPESKKCEDAQYNLAS